MALKSVTLPTSQAAVDGGEKVYVWNLNASAACTVSASRERGGAQIDIWAASAAGQNLNSGAGIGPFTDVWSSAGTVYCHIGREAR
jgi:hypothetical protein